MTQAGSADLQQDIDYLRGVLPCDWRWEPEGMFFHCEHDLNIRLWAVKQLREWDSDVLRENLQHHHEGAG